MSLWEFSAALGGYAKANTTADDQGISAADAERLADWIDQPPIWH